MRPFSIIIVFVALMLAGLAFIPVLGIQLHPSDELPTMDISFSWAGAPAIAVEKEVTSKIESALSTIRGLKDINSISRFGSGQVSVGLKKGVNVELARFEVSTHIRRLYPGLPDGVSYPSISAHRASGRSNSLLTYRIVAPEPTQHIAQYIEQQIIPRLVQIKGLANVRLQGANSFEYQLMYHPEKLKTWGLSVDDISMAVSNYFSESYLGLTHYHPNPMAGESRLPVMLKSGNNRKPTFDQIPLGGVSDPIILLADLASVRFVEQAPQSYYRINGKTALLMVITAAKGENQIKLSDRTKRAIIKLEQQMPEGWQMLLAYDDTEHIRKDLKRVGLRMLFSFTVLMLFVLLVSGQPWYLFMILATVLANLLLAISWYHLLGIEIHLYSLAGITVSFGIIIDNSIVMIEHMRHHKNKRVFLAILAATVTTMGCLSVIFLLDEQQQIQLRDFVGVMLVNLFLSLLIAWFFISALFVKTRMAKKTGSFFKASTRKKVRFSRLYMQFILLTRKFRWLVFLLLILGFGLPVHLLPDRLAGESTAVKVYNKTIGSPFYQLRVKRFAEKALGGAFRLFSKHVYERSFFTDPERTSLRIQGQMPDGATICQLNDAIMKMENYLSTFPRIEQFMTSISSHSQGSITVHFRPEDDQGAFPHELKNHVVQKALSVGGTEWSVSGVGRTFSNVLGGGGGGQMRIILEGYNYDQLYRYAEILMEMAMQNPRVEEPSIHGTDPWQSRSRNEFYMSFDTEKLAMHNLSRHEIYQNLRDQIMARNVANVLGEDGPVAVSLVPENYLQYSVWDLANRPLCINGGYYKPGAFLSLQKMAMGNDIYRYNQQYRLVFGYTFIGPSLMEARFANQLLEEINQIMPLGYQASVRTWSWHTEKNRQHLLILLVIVIIYMICSILLESLLQPLAIIGLIPVSYIGLFLTFYLFDLNFDQGGWAAFILLSGLAVNAGLYILNDLNNYRNTHSRRPMPALYLKAFQYKIFPVVLTVGSTIIGLVPFLVGKKEPFWFAFAAGTIGGLVFSLLAIMVFFPVFLKYKNRKHE